MKKTLLFILGILFAAGAHYVLANYEAPFLDSVKRIAQCRVTRDAPSAPYSAASLDSFIYSADAKEIYDLGVAIYNGPELQRSKEVGTILVGIAKTKEPLPLTDEEKQDIIENSNVLALSELQEQVNRKTKVIHTCATIAYENQLAGFVESKQQSITAYFTNKGTFADFVVPPPKKLYGVPNTVNRAQVTFDDQRKFNVEGFSQVIRSYKESTGSIPASIPLNTPGEICRRDPKYKVDCTGYVNLEVLTQYSGGVTLGGMYADPEYYSTAGTGYFVHVDSEGKVTVTAPHATVPTSFTN